MRGREDAFLKKRHPKQVLVVPQSAATILQIRLLQINAIAELGMADLLITHPHRDVLALVTIDGISAMPYKVEWNFMMQRPSPVQPASSR